MLVKFKDGTTKKCSNPTEQKIFKGGNAAGWLCSLAISGPMTSAEIDALLTDDNISNCDFINENGTTLFSIGGYTKVTSVVERYTESAGIIEIQLTKGV